MWYHSFILDIYFITNWIVNVSFQTFKGVAVSCQEEGGQVSRQVWFHHLIYFHQYQGSDIANSNLIAF